MFWFLNWLGFNIVWAETTPTTYHADGSTVGILD